MSFSEIAVLACGRYERHPNVGEALKNIASNITLLENRIILLPHGPILLRGGRGSGKSALLKEASIRINNDNSYGAFAIYVSLRYLPLLRYTESEYETFCDEGKWFLER